MKDTTTIKPDGTVTPYGFACGIVQRAGEIRLYKDGVYHVQGLGVWESYGSLTEARRAFARLVKRDKAIETAFDSVKADFDKLMAGLALNAGRPN